MKPPFHSNFSVHWELLNVMSSELASFRIVPERLPFVLKSLEKGSDKMFFNSQFNICACFNLIHVEIPAGPLLFNLVRRPVIWLSLSTFHIFGILYIPL